MARDTEKTANALGEFMDKILDIDALLAPISGDASAGMELSGGSTEFMAIAEALKSDADENLGDWKPESIKKADYRRALQLAKAALTDKSKHLQLACWLAEAATLQYGLKGFNESLAFLHRFLKEYWVTMYPSLDPEDGSVDSRIKPLGGCVTKLTREVSLFPLAFAGGKAYGLERYNQAKKVDQLKKLPNNEDGKNGLDYYNEAIDSGKIDGAMFDEIALLTPVDSLTETLELLAEGKDLTSELQILVAELYVEDGVPNDYAPSFSEIKGLLEECIRVIKRFAGARISDGHVANEGDGRSADEEHRDSAVGSTDVPQIRFSASVGSASIASRRAALKQLSEVANFFKTNEPHSPVSYLVNKAVEWGNLPLNELLRELVEDDSVLARIDKTLGIIRS